MSAPKSPHETVNTFLHAVRRRLTIRRLARVAVTVTGVVAAGLLAAALSRVLSGYAVEAWWYGAAAAAAAIATLVGWLATLPSADASAREADGAFGLHDAVASWLHFRRDHKEGGFYELQAKQTAERVDPLDTDRVGIRPPRNRVLVALGLVLVAGALGFVPVSEAVQQRLAQESFTLTESSRINEEFEQLLDELTKDLDEEERELIDPDKIREQIDALEETADSKTALRQYARLEQHLQKQLARLNQRRDEQLAAKAAEELDKSAETRKLADPLRGKQYDKAAEQIAGLTPSKTAKLSEQQKQAARLRAASQRMAAAARGRRGSGSSQSSGSPSESGAKSTGSSGSQGSKGSASGAGGQGKGGGEGGESGGDQGELGQAMLELDAVTAELEDAIREALRQEKRDGQCDSECQKRLGKCQSQCEGSCDKLSRCLSKMAVKKKARSRLASLCKSCSQCQAGLCQSQAACNKPGGKKAGSAVDDSRGSPSNDPLATGPLEQLTGIKGEGPSQKTTESADDGSGVSGRVAEVKQREFRRRVESFVNREDISAGVRRGVKRYFESIHNIEPAADGATGEGL